MPPVDRAPGDVASDRLDRDRFAALFEAAYAQLWLIATAIIGERMGAEDIVQESALAAWEKHEQFRPGTNFNAWLARFVRWHALNFVRKQAGRNTHPADPRQLDLSAAEPPAEALDLQLDTTGGLAEYQVHFDDDVTRALRSVSDMGRACMLLRTVHQLSYREISQLLEIPEGTAMSHVHRTRQVLRERLKSYLVTQSTDDPSTS